MHAKEWCVGAGLKEKNGGIDTMDYDFDKGGIDTNVTIFFL